MAGNVNSGRRKNTFIEDAILMEMKQREKDKDKAGVRKLSVKVWDLAEAGERWAVEFLRDTLDGKPMQRVEHAGDSDNPIHHVIQRRIIDPGK